MRLLLSCRITKVEAPGKGFKSGDAPNNYTEGRESACTENLEFSQ
jgi:hypothetical protein